ncbi:hypothetical protein ACOSP7_001012 [Xanthoceras sorbifolium]
MDSKELAKLCAAIAIADVDAPIAKVEGKLKEIDDRKIKGTDYPFGLWLRASSPPKTRPVHQERFFRSPADKQPYSQKDAYVALETENFNVVGDELGGENVSVGGISSKGQYGSTFGISCVMHDVNVKILPAWMLIKGLPCQTRFLRSECEIEAGNECEGLVDEAEVNDQEVIGARVQRYKWKRRAHESMKVDGGCFIESCREKRLGHSSELIDGWAIKRAKHN